MDEEPTEEAKKPQEVAVAMVEEPKDAAVQMEEAKKPEVAVEKVAVGKVAVEKLSQEVEKLSQEVEKLLQEQTAKEELPQAALPAGFALKQKVEEKPNDAADADAESKLKQWLKTPP